MINEGPEDNSEESNDFIDEKTDIFIQNEARFKRLYAGISTDHAKLISKKSREDHKYDSTTLSYGEIIYEPFGQILLELLPFYPQNFEHCKFLDIGAGVGKAVWAAFFLNLFGSYQGIEILPELHSYCEKSIKVYNRRFHVDDDHIKVNFSLGDATFIDWSDSEICFIHSTCFNNTMLDRILEIAINMKRGSILITLSKSLHENEHFQVVHKTKLEVSHGICSVFVHKKILVPTSKKQIIRNRLQLILEKNYDF